MKKKLSVTIHCLFFVICAALAVSVLYHMVFTRRLNLKYTPAVLEESQGLRVLAHGENAVSGDLSAAGDG